MTKIINLVGQPGTGKSTTMADLFVKLKLSGTRVEMCPEWIKKWAWEDKKPDKYDQLYIMSKEISQQKRLFNKVDYIISDSPVFLSAFYQKHFYDDDFLEGVAKNYYEMVKEDNVEVYTFFLFRNKPYDPKGRYQTEEESDKIAKEMYDWLMQTGFMFWDLRCPDELRVDNILELIEWEEKWRLNH